MKFVALGDFYSDELQSSYCMGLTYTVRAEPVFNDRGEMLGALKPEHSLLAKMVRKWSAAQPPLVRVLGEEERGTGDGEITGTGVVIDSIKGGR